MLLVPLLRYFTEMTNPDVNDETLDSADGGNPLFAISLGLSKFTDDWRNEQQTKESLSAIDKIKAYQSNTQALKDLHNDMVEYMASQKSLES